VKQSIQNKLYSLIDRHEEIAGLLADPGVIGDQNQFRELSREYAQLEPVVNCFQQYNQAQADMNSAAEMLEDDDAEMRDMAADEINRPDSRLKHWRRGYRSCCCPKPK